MRIDRTSRTPRRLMVLGSCSLLVMAVIGPASAHSLTSGRTGAMLSGDLRAVRIHLMEPDLDEQEIADLLEAEDADDAASEDATSNDDQGNQADEHDGDRADGPREGQHERETAVEAKPKAHASHHSTSDASDKDKRDDEDENENEDAEDGDHDGDHEDGDHEDDHDDGGSHDGGDDSHDD